MRVAFVWIPVGVLCSVLDACCLSSRLLNVIDVEPSKLGQDACGRVRDR